MKENQEKEMKDTLKRKWDTKWQKAIGKGERHKET